MYRLSIYSLFFIYFLIFLGSFVRSTGSGMGCPDWPRCFGFWIPPINKSQLPNNYYEIFYNKRIKKNKNIVNVLEKLNVPLLLLLSKKIKNEYKVKEYFSFNLFKTWIEYFNRIVGVITGFLIFFIFFFSIFLIKKNKNIFFFFFFFFFLTILQGLIGSLVVSTHLLLWVITLHMFISLLIIVSLIYLIYLVKKKNIYLYSLYSYDFKYKKVLVLFFLFCFFLLIFQILLGSYTRESIDLISIYLYSINKKIWVNQLGFYFEIHRFFSFFILFIYLFLFYYFFIFSNSTFYKFFKLTLLFILLVIFLGFILSYVNFSFLFQSFHFLLASLIFSIKFYLICLFRNFKIFNLKYL